MKDENARREWAIKNENNREIFHNAQDAALEAALHIIGNDAKNDFIEHEVDKARKIWNDADALAMAEFDANRL